MNNPHHGARLTVYSREQIVARVTAGQRAAEVAAAFGVSVRTVRKWLARFRAGGARRCAAVAQRIASSTSACAARQSCPLAGGAQQADRAHPLGLERAFTNLEGRYGLGRMRCRGLEANAFHVDLVAIAHNLRQAAARA